MGKDIDRYEPEGDGGRTFLALYPPREALDEMWELKQNFLSALKQEHLLRPVKREQMHITLRFFEYLSAEERDNYISLLNKALEPLPPLRLYISALGGFPHLRKPRVLWLGLEPSEGVRALFSIANEAGRNCGLMSEHKPFTAHITIARVNDPNRLKGAEEAAEKTVSESEEHIWNLVQLMDSKLASRGAEHTPLASWELKG